MRFKKVLLVNFSYKGSSITEPKLHSGLGYISQSLEDNCIEHEVFDMSLGYKITDLLNTITGFSPFLIGITLMTYRYKDSYQYIRCLKQRFPDIKIVTGGPHISLLREKVLNECEAIDYGIVLEGEQTIVELCKDELEIKDIKGLIFRQNNKAIFNGEREFNRNLDSVSFPKYNKFELKKYPRKSTTTAVRDIPIVSSRGCPSQCIFCPVKTSIGRLFRYRSALNILSEIKYWYEKGYRTFWTADDNFTLIRERVLEVCRLIKKSGMNNLLLGCGNGIRADRIDRELLSAMKSVGFKTILFGIEGGNNKILKTLKKGETMETIEAAIKIALDLDFSVMASFLIGSPGETTADIEDSFNIVRKYPFTEVFFFHIIPYPKTELYEWTEKNGYFVYDPQRYLNEAIPVKNNPVYGTPELPVKERKKIFLKARRLSKQVKTNYYVRLLVEVGIPKPLSKIVASVYNTKFVNSFVNKTKIIRTIKDKISSLKIKL